MNQCLSLLKGLALSLWRVIRTLLTVFIPKRFFFKDVKEKIVVITGGGSGFGRILANKFAIDHKCTVVIWDVNKDGLVQTVNEIRNRDGKCYQYVVDVADKKAVYAAAKRVKTDVGTVYMLINNAGIGEGDFLLDAKDEYIEKIYSINILAHYWTVKAFLPEMLAAREGHIVTISSVAGFLGSPRLTHYCGTKHAAMGFHESLTAELLFQYPEANINTTVICPYFTRTPMVAGKEHEIPPSSWLLPIQEAEPVVQEMVESILTNEDILITAFVCRILAFMNAVIPSKVMKAFRSTLTRLTMPKFKSN